MKRVSEEPADVTTLLASWRSGDADALARLTPLVYDELRRIAHTHLRRERRRDVWQTTALVHDAYLRLTSGSPIEWQNRVHFFAVAARIIRRLLVDAARQRISEKRGGGAIRADVLVEHLPDECLTCANEIEDLEEALNRLAGFDARRARVVELRFFGGLTVEEVAEVLDVSPRTVAHDWTIAKAWLSRELSRTPPRARR